MPMLVKLSDKGVRVYMATNGINTDTTDGIGRNRTGNIAEIAIHDRSHMRM